MREKRRFADGTEQNPGGGREELGRPGPEAGPLRTPGPADEVGNEPREPAHDCASSGAVGSGTAEPPQA